MKRRVFNLTNNALAYFDKTLAPNGGSDFFDLDFVPNRDLELARKGVIAFDKLPPGWVPNMEVAPTVEPNTPKALKIELKEEVKVEEKPSYHSFKETGKKRSLDTIK